MPWPPMGRANRRSDPHGSRSAAHSSRTIPCAVTRFAYESPDPSLCSNRGAPFAAVNASKAAAARRDGADAGDLGSEDLAQHLRVEVERVDVHPAQDLHDGGGVDRGDLDPLPVGCPHLCGSDDVDPLATERLRQVRSGPELGVVDVPSLGTDVAAERQRRGDRDLDLGEVVLPTRRPPVAFERSHVADHGPLDPCDPRGADLLRERVQSGGRELGIAVTDQPQVAVDHAVHGTPPSPSHAFAITRSGPTAASSAIDRSSFSFDAGARITHARCRYQTSPSFADRHRHPSAADQLVDLALPSRRIVRAGGRDRPRRTVAGPAPGAAWPAAGMPATMERASRMARRHRARMSGRWYEVDRAPGGRGVTYLARAPRPRRASRCAPPGASAARAVRAAVRRSTPARGRT